MRLSVCRRVGTGALLQLLIAASPASAQVVYGATAPAIGERYHVELGLAFWNPDPLAIVSSEGLDIEGTDVDLVDDLGIERKRMLELRTVLRPATKHKFRFHYLPVRYEAEAIVQREFVFNGQVYRIGLPVQTDAKFTTYRFGYEYDFFYRRRGYIGALVDLKYTDVDLALETPVRSEFARQAAPIPGIGVVGRGYVARNVAITGEWTFFKVPGNLSDEFGGHYRDYDFYGTVNFTDNVGAQFGLRSIDVEYFKDLDRGDLNFTGWYFSGVVRF